MVENVDTPVKPQSEDRLPYGTVLFLSMIFTCIVANVITFAQQSDFFDSWNPLPILPSGVAHIVDADADNIWVEDGNGNLYTLTLQCANNDNCPEWQRVQDATAIQPFVCHSTTRAAACTGLAGSYSPNPLSGEVKECILAEGCSFEPSYGYETYFALMSDGTVKYWEHGSGTLVLASNFVLSSVVLPLIVAVIISIIYWGRHVAKTVKAA
jgi:hypothetical protein